MRNVFGFYDDEGIARYPIYISENSYETSIDLLYWNQHYAAITNFSRFIADLHYSTVKKEFCKKCFGLFVAKVDYERHLPYCKADQIPDPIFLFPRQGQGLQFKNTRYMDQIPYVIYADFECLLMDIKEAAGGKTILYAQHTPCSVAFKVVSRDPSLPEFPLEIYTGKHSGEWLLDRLGAIEEEIIEILYDEKRLIFTAEDKKIFDYAKACYICYNWFDPQNPSDKVRDHDHLTGKFRGAAHSRCNLLLQKTVKIPVFFHNFRGYDSHIIVRALERAESIKSIKVIGQGLEKYLVLNLGKYLVFKDSYQFMSASLENLAKNLAKEGGVNNFHLLTKEFTNILPSAGLKERLELIIRKGVYPYEYMNDWKKFELQNLPRIEDFANTLRNEQCSPTDYAHAENVWKMFSCKTMKDYHELYLKMDVLLLADIFEAYRKFSLEYYRLDPAHYVSSPHLSWDAMLLHTNMVLDLIWDPKMFQMLNNGIRGGVAMITKRHAKANNPEMKENYDPSQPISYIIYLDANNLYGWAMSQRMPYGGFKWLKAKEWEKISWLELTENDYHGYFIECDLDYPNEIHDAHQEYPLAPERLNMSYERLNETQLKILKRYRITNSGLNCTKLVPHLMKHEKYCVHYLNLKFYLEHGMKLVKIHRVIQFIQSTWLAPYIKKNSDLRATAKNDFDKDNAKLMNNSIYGKTVENVTKRTDIRLVNSEEKCTILINKPHMLRYKIFSENLAAIELRKTKAKIDKPFYVGFAVLELSKLLMYRFHYDYIKKEFGDKAEFLFTDTDSLMYRIFDSNLYKKFYDDRKKYFDFSEYPLSHMCFDESNKRVVGFFKDEAKGEIITEFIGLRPKMYSYLQLHENGNVEEKHRAKGIQKELARKYRHLDYLKELKDPIENLIKTKRIGTKLHQIYSIETTKRGLCAFDDKRVLLDDEINTLPYGHYSVTGHVESLNEEVPNIPASQDTDPIENVRVGKDKDEGTIFVPCGANISDFFRQEQFNRIGKSLRKTRTIGPSSVCDKKIVFLPETISQQVQNIIKEFIKKKNFSGSEEAALCRDLYIPVLKATKVYSTKKSLENFIDALMEEVRKADVPHSASVHASKLFILPSIESDQE